MNLWYSSKVSVGKLVSKSYWKLSLLTVYPLIKNPLSHGLDLTPLKLRPSDNNIASHLCSAHRFDAIHYVECF